MRNVTVRVQRKIATLIVIILLSTNGITTAHSSTFNSQMCRYIAHLLCTFIHHILYVDTV